jgi:hypothetical protein
MSKSEKVEWRFFQVNGEISLNQKIKKGQQETERRIRGAGLPGPTKVSGRYTENPGTPEEKKWEKKSHIVSSGKMGKRRLRKQLRNSELRVD